MIWIIYCLGHSFVATHSAFAHQQVTGKHPLAVGGSAGTFSNMGSETLLLKGLLGLSVETDGWTGSTATDLEALCKWTEIRMGEISKVTFLTFCFIFKKTCTERICIENLLETHGFCVCVFLVFFFSLFFSFNF